MPKNKLDQFETYEVFVQTKEDKPFEHVGIVHAPNEEMAFCLQKSNTQEEACSVSPFA